MLIENSIDRSSIEKYFKDQYVQYKYIVIPSGFFVTVSFALDPRSTFQNVSSEVPLFRDVIAIPTIGSEFNMDTLCTANDVCI
jgi:hypothetical protein